MPPETISCDFVLLADLAQRVGGDAHGRQRRDTGMLDEHVLGGTGAALEPVDHHDIGAGGDGQLHVVNSTRVAPTFT